MFQKLATQYGREVLIFVGKSVFLRVEKIYVAGKLRAGRRGCDATLRFSGRPVITAANFTISQLLFQRRRDLQIHTHLQNAIVRTARRRDREGFPEASEMRLEI